VAVPLQTIADLQTVVNALQQMTTQIGHLTKQIATSVPFMPGTGLVNAASDSAAASAGVPVNGMYRNGSVLMVRVV
jgi:sugar (pentulose or hexulose) kinase